MKRLVLLSAFTLACTRERDPDPPPSPEQAELTALHAIVSP